MCKNGDPNAYTELYNKYAKYVYNAICRYVEHTAEAEDILQETFVDAYRNINSLNNPNNFGGWVKRIAINKAINWLQRRRFKMIELEPEKESIAEEPIDEDDFEYTMSKVNKAIEALPLIYKTVFQLYAIENIPQLEIAQLLGMTHTGVRTQYFRAKNKLLETLKEIQYER
ncbi:hypothetical protein AQF98_13990 [Pedobacter sp. Hv1]|nr:hypothetical protein AQF98_13990 [Pedobacter sp. Hv1]